MDQLVSISGPRNQVGKAVLAEAAIELHLSQLEQTEGEDPVQTLYFGGIALDRYAKLWHADLVRRNAAGTVQSSLELQVEGKFQPFEAGLYLEPDDETDRSPHGKSAAFLRIQGVISQIRAALGSTPSRLSLLVSGVPFACPHRLAFRARADNRNGAPHELWINVPHPSTFLLSCIRQIQLASDLIRTASTSGRGDVPLLVGHRNAQARLLRLCVDLLDKTGHSNTETSDAVWPRHFRNPAILHTPGDVAARYLTGEVVTEAAEWEASKEGRVDTAHVNQLKLKYHGAFERVKLWTSRVLTQNEINQQPKSCFEGYQNSCGFHYIIT